MADIRGTAPPARASGSPQASKISTTSLNKRKTKTSSRSFLGYVLNTVARIFTWYSIFVLLFRCPSSLEECDTSSPWLCKPYFQIKQAVAPHVHKHYDAYAAPYVQVVRPYYDTVDRTVIAPAWKYAVKYGAPQVEQAQAFGQAQWTSNIQPQLAKAQNAAFQQYNQVLGPHVDKAATAVAPYYEIGRNSALQTHHEVILPAYEFLSPYALQGYSAASAFTTGTVVPVAIWTYGQASEFIDSTVLPQLRIFYVNTVEPQLQKIGLNIGQYTEKVTSQRTAYTSGASSSFTKPAQPTTSTTSIKASSSTTTTSTSTAHTEQPETTSIATAAAASSTASAAPAPAGITDAAKLKRPEPIVQDQAESAEDEVRRLARETVAEDLHAWQEKYAKAADEGAAEIEKSVEEISKRMIRRSARTSGKALVDGLQNTVVTNLVQLRRDIVNIIGAVKQETTTPSAAEEQVLVVVRRAGVEIKEKAQAVRSWREEYGKELQDTISRAAENHFQILGSIRDLALQRIGMKWAWMEGITYKDWAKYHQLKGRFEEWENDLEQLIVTHPGLEAATSAGQAVEDEAMGVAASAAKELGRLRQVAELKIAELDDSDEFDADTIKANVAAAKAAKEAEESAEAARLAKEAEEAAAAEAAAQATLEEEAAARSEALAAAAATAEVVGAEPITEATEATEEGQAEGKEAAVPPKITNDDEAAESVLADEAAEAEAEADTEAADAATIAPDEVPIILGDANGVVDDSPTQETTELADAESTADAKTVHLPVDEVDEAVEADEAATAEETTDAL
ncbi:hypothetical protein SPBR_04694 [Sporothrix brasiliensis 5110]|uniref:Transcription factor hoxa13 n=1 Tax=Sporothrix brasiliensis 5110 TaxID=1398154 RepID=A0A0C2EP00_9PEZI|nr:uncharacterized protein SPBR_04694 [Sporothrix brasiliensis 5110]KIH87889.1 hypothetical protein SPBR_04694 [Sporothrix brasiliensis 5110]